MTAELIFLNNESNRLMKWKLSENTLYICYLESNDNRWYHLETTRDSKATKDRANDRFKRMVQIVLIDNVTYSLLKLSMDVIE